MTTILTHIRQLLNVRQDPVLLRGRAMCDLPAIEDAYLVIEDGIIAAYGTMKQFPDHYHQHADTLDVRGGLVLPAWCDSHTHLVFAGSRESEFVDRIRGLSYADIAVKGGGSSTPPVCSTRLPRTNSSGSRGKGCRRWLLLERGPPR